MRKAGGAVSAKQQSKRSEVGIGADDVEQRIECQTADQQDSDDGRKDQRQHLACAVCDPLGDEAAQSTEHQHASNQHGRRNGGIGQRQVEAADETHLDHNIADAEAGEIDDRAELAGRGAETSAPADKDGHDDQRGRQ